MSSSARPPSSSSPEIPHGSEAFSFWTHVAGAALSVLGLAILLREATTLAADLAAAVYGGSMILLFSSSALHHTFPRAPAALKASLRRLDHCAIYLLIAGTYTPVCLLALPAAVGRPILAFVWALALAGVVWKAFFRLGSRRIDAALYIAMGWSAVLVVKPIFDRFPPEAVALLAAGGVAYTAGAVIYARKRPDPWPARVGFHGVWHVFVLAGAACHFAFVVLHVT